MTKYKRIASGSTWIARENFETEVNDFLMCMPSNKQDLTSIKFETGFCDGEVREYVCHIIYEQYE